MQDLVQRGFCQFNAHQKNQHGHRQTGEILDTAVAKGMVNIRLLTCQLEAQQRDAGTACIGEVVEGVGSDGNGAGEDTGEKFAGKQKFAAP